MIPLAPFELSIFLLGTFVAAFVTGVSGFAFGMVAAAIWLHALTSVQSTPLIVAYALLVQGYAVWKLRRAINLRRLAPFVAGTAVGVPVGAIVLEWASTAHLRAGVGVLLILFSLYSLIRPALPQVKRAGVELDGGVGVLNGIIGASTGLGGILPTLWCGMRGWNRDEQRAVFQPTAVATFLMTLLWLGATGATTGDVWILFAAGLPVLALGSWLGWKTYAHIDEATFRKIVLYGLLLAGVTLVLK
ncbi:MAG TPA: sulfite exporter TauE/SafE family protein [Burkholderiales bacterium]|nr:sulfite exporter TauE/SafE family protein [Burkholderiales bacterium]